MHISTDPSYIFESDSNCPPPPTPFYYYENVSTPRLDSDILEPPLGYWSTNPDDWPPANLSAADEHARQCNEFLGVTSDGVLVYEQHIDDMQFRSYVRYVRPQPVPSRTTLTRRELQGCRGQVPPHYGRMRAPVCAAARRGAGRGRVHALRLRCRADGEDRGC